MLKRVGTTYIPVTHPETASRWYKEKLGAEEEYRDGDKAIMNLADQSFFLVKAARDERAEFTDSSGKRRFTLTFEVDGLTALKNLHADMNEKGVKTGDIENRGHVGRNFVFYDQDGNPFDVWSELSPQYKNHL
ncbi:VOC family protein [Alteribacter natronophilus]|uniref:VOC family protein n=1 Tax=Alteribacter natronophilus TaxID=2583810 RepID=UPI00110D447E|nr:VOC family protein [Alteribacter natronophilus]TMW71004.1 VOC family protein [Alteribacter natronophilus]